MFPVKIRSKLEHLTDINVSGKSEGAVLTYDAKLRKYVFKQPFRYREKYSLEDLADVRIVEVDDGYHLSYNVNSGYWESRGSIDSGYVEEVLTPVTHDFGDSLVVNSLEDVYAPNPGHHAVFLYDANESRFVAASILDGGVVGEAFPAPEAPADPKSGVYFDRLIDVNISNFTHGQIVVYESVFDQWVLTEIDTGDVGVVGVDPVRLVGNTLVSHGDTLVYNGYTGLFEPMDILGMITDINTNFDSRVVDVMNATLTGIDSEEIIL